MTTNPPDAIDLALHLLGYTVRDRVTDMTGVVTSIAFDLYGCVQAALHPGLDADGKLREVHWYDIARLTRDGCPQPRVMNPPDFRQSNITAVEQYNRGPAEKPAMSKS